MASEATKQQFTTAVLSAGARRTSAWGFMIRQCIEHALRLCKLEQGKGNDTWVTSCELRLFAPARRGFVPSSWKALLYQFANWVPLLSSLPLIYPAYGELQPTSTFLQDLKRRTEGLANENPGLKCFRGRILYGRKEDVVCPGDFDCDYPPDIENGVGHEPNKPEI
jgi:hypothetical protein